MWKIDRWGWRFPLTLRSMAIGCSCLYLATGLSSAVFAQPKSDLSPTEICQVDFNLLKSSDVDTDPNIVTADKVSPQGMTTPSLWWTSEQFSAKLVTNWIANRSQKQVYLLVNGQYWNTLDYIDRYRTIDRFGNTAQSYGYNLSICNSQKIILARYTCEEGDNSAATESLHTAAPLARHQYSCQIWLNPIGQDGWSVQMK